MGLQIWRRQRGGRCGDEEPPRRQGGEPGRDVGLGLPVPPGFTITTEVCIAYYANDRAYPDGLSDQVDAALAFIEETVGASFGDPENPLLVSVRSGARASMPG